MHARVVLNDVDRDRRGEPQHRQIHNAHQGDFRERRTLHCRMDRVARDQRIEPARLRQLESHARRPDPLPGAPVAHAVRSGDDGVVSDRGAGANQRPGRDLPDRRYEARGRDHVGRHTGAVHLLRVRRAGPVHRRLTRRAAGPHRRCAKPERNYSPPPSPPPAKTVPSRTLAPSRTSLRCGFH